jgi:hypothetical protein
MCNEVDMLHIRFNNDQLIIDIIASSVSEPSATSLLARVTWGGCYNVMSNDYLHRWTSGKLPVGVIGRFKEALAVCAMYLGADRLVVAVF